MPFSQIGLAPPQSAAPSLQKRLAQLGIAMLLGGPLAYDVMRTRLDPLLVYAYSGTEGPLASVVSQGGVPRPGEPISSIGVGGTVWWISTLCVHEGTTMTAFVALVREEDGRVVHQRDRTFSPADKRCGPMAGSVTVPADAPLGMYRVERKMQLTGGGGPPKVELLPAIRFEVTR